MTQFPFVIIAMDGGAASGKSTTSRALAEELNLLHVDTGMHYRSLTHVLLKGEVDITSERAVAGYLPRLKMGTRIEGHKASLLINGRVISEKALRSLEVNECVSEVAAMPEVRAFLLEYQRSQEKVARRKKFKGLVMEGRDIGSVIFPSAHFRFFLHANAETRAKRRAKEGIEDSIEKRDLKDSTRKTAPLMCPAGATIVDTSKFTLEEVVRKVRGIVSPEMSETSK